ncbi:tetratricopeptide repeat protein [Sphingomonas sp. 7/4-4]|uniref:tetratricopeptide repeat protein n=1 Tax=Sphingomonas sp. 7/4-4 TaxID=3018446 RepID=UPI0022F3C084|nr:tetratricopeptide repeat protein [Sphingomonas sp. 7/4-4]WBY07499.1 tetratricopeptide repeat protein [Sphingomonas sp. 7/4-4]
MRRGTASRLALCGILLAANGCMGSDGRLALPEGTRFTGKPEVSLAAAQRFVANGNYGLGIETYRRYLSANPEDARAVEGLAIAYDRLQRFDLSDRYFQQALALAPRDPEIYMAYGRSLRAQGKDFDADLLDVDMRAMLAQDAPNAGIAAATPAIAAPVIAASQAIVPVAPAGRQRQGPGSIAPRRAKSGWFCRLRAMRPPMALPRARLCVQRRRCRSLRCRHGSSTPPGGRG